MKIVQKKDGSGTIYFDDNELNVLNKTKKLEMSPYFLKHFCNHVMKIMIEFNENFEKDIKKMNTSEDTIIKTKTE